MLQLVSLHVCIPVGFFTSVTVIMCCCKFKLQPYLIKNSHILHKKNEKGKNMNVISRNLRSIPKLIVQYSCRQ